MKVSSRHRTQCQICQHPEREQIEHDFLNWTSARELAQEYGLGSYRAVYRHAEARGLLERRRVRMRLAVDQIIEHARNVNLTAGAVVAAMRLGFQMDQREEAKKSGEIAREAQRLPMPSGQVPPMPRGKVKERRPQFIMTLDGWPRSDAVHPHPKPGDPPRRDLLLEEIERDHPEWLEGPVVRLLRPDAADRGSPASSGGGVSTVPTDPVASSGADTPARAPLPTDSDAKAAPLGPKGAAPIRTDAGKMPALPGRDISVHATPISGQAAPLTPKGAAPTGMQTTHGQEEGAGKSEARTNLRTNVVTDKNCFAFPSPCPWDGPEYQPRPPKKYGPNDVIPRW